MEDVSVDWKKYKMLVGEDADLSVQVAEIGQDQPRESQRNSSAGTVKG